MIQVFKDCSFDFFWQYDQHLLSFLLAFFFKIWLHFLWNCLHFFFFLLFYSHCTVHGRLHNFCALTFKEQFESLVLQSTWFKTNSVWKDLCVFFTSQKRKIASSSAGLFWVSCGSRGMCRTAGVRDTRATWSEIELLRTIISFLWKQAWVAESCVFEANCVTGIWNLHIFY